MKLSWILLLVGAVAGGAPAAAGRWPSDSFDTEGGKLVITFFGHASLMLEYGGTVVQVDPVGQYADYGTLPGADLILVTHEHQDHLDPSAIAKLVKPGTEILLNGAARARLGKGTPLAYGEKRSVGPFTVEALPAYNTSADRLSFHPKGRDNGYLVTVGGKRIYIAGDTEDTPEMRALRDIDIAFLPMNLPYTMTPEQVAAAAKAFRPKVLYPYHYGSTDPEKLVRLLAGEAGIAVRIRPLR